MAVLCQNKTDIYIYTIYKHTKTQPILSCLYRIASGMRSMTSSLSTPFEKETTEGTFPFTRSYAHVLPFLTFSGD